MQRGDTVSLCAAFVYSAIHERPPGPGVIVLQRATSPKGSRIDRRSPSMNRAHVRLNFARAHDYVRRLIFRYTSEFSPSWTIAFNAMGIQRASCCAERELRQLLTISVSFLFDLGVRLMPDTRSRDRIQN